MENDKIKTSRASQTRDKIEVKKVWTPPNSLDAPPAQLDIDINGYVPRYSDNQMLKI